MPGTLGDPDGATGQSAPAELDFAALADTLPTLVFVADADGRLIYSNRRLQAYSGAGAGELLGDGWLSLVHPADREGARLGWAAAVGSGEAYEAEHRIRAADGGYRWFQARGEGVRRAGRVTRWVGNLCDIDDRKRAEVARVGERDDALTALHESEAQFRTVFQSQFTFVGLMTPEGVLIEANDAALRFGGFPAAAVLGRKFWETPWWDLGEAVQEKLRRSMAAARTGAFIRYETEVRGAGGRTTVIDFSIKPVLNGAGRVVMLVPEGRDIGEQRRAEVALRDNEERLRLAQEVGGIGAWELDMRTGERRWSPSTYRLWGMEPGLPVTDDFLLSRLHPDDVAAAREALARARMPDGPPRDLELRIVRDSDGAVRWLNFRSEIASRDPLTGLPLRQIGIARDVTERREAQDALQASKARLRAILDSMPQIVWSALPDGTHDFHNRRWYEYTGRDEGATDGAPDGAADGATTAAAGGGVFHPDDLAETCARWKHSLATGEPFEVECRLRQHDGVYRWVLNRALPVRDASGAISRWMGTCTDLEEMVCTREALATSRAELEQRVVERTRELSLVNGRLSREMRRRESMQAALLQSQKMEALGELTSGVAHDFNNVIAAIAGGFGVIARRSTDARLTDIAGHGLRAAERGGALVRQLLGVARGQKLTPAIWRPEELVSEIEPLLRRSAGAAVAFSAACPADLPPVFVDAAQLEAALVNLAVNARDAMPDGGSLVLGLRLSGNEDPAHPPEMGSADAIAITLADTGPGMAPRVLQRVTEPFFTTKGPGRGTGLGLAMVRGFVQQSGGALRIESRVGLGTNITLYLPLASAAEQLAGATPEEPAARADLHGEARLLVVDDDDDVRAVVAAELADLGYSVAQAATVQEAVAAVAAGPVPGLVLTDVALQGGSGPGLAAYLRRLHPGLPVLFMTGQAGRDGLEGEQVMAKPFAANDLATRVSDLLASAEAGAAQDNEMLETLQGRIRSAPLRTLLRNWVEARGDTMLPRSLPLADPGPFDGPGAVVGQAGVVLIDVDPGKVPITFQVRSASGGLDGGLEAPLAGSSVPVTGDEALGSREAAYRRCVRTCKPSYEYARFGFGEGRPTLFERLLLPLAGDGTTVSTILAAIVITDGEAGDLAGR